MVIIKIVDLYRTHTMVHLFMEKIAKDINNQNIHHITYGTTSGNLTPKNITNHIQPSIHKVINKAFNRLGICILIII